MFHILIAVIVFCIWTSGSSFADVIPYTHYRLPTSVRPDQYHLKIITHLDEASNFTFDGEVTIRFQTLEDIHNITLHVKNLSVDNTRLELKSYNGIVDLSSYLSGIDTVPELDYYIIHFNESLDKNELYNITLHFKGNLKDDVHGYYRSSYLDKLTNESKWISVTQFEPALARSAFPCFDEPNYKANFTIWLGHHKSLTALSNMPLEKQIPLDGEENFVWSIFEESVPMSTYLVSYTINDFSYKESKLEGSDIVFRIWCRQEFIEDCEYATRVAPIILKYFEEIFMIPFPLKKLDQMAIPDFSALGMENWGLINYQQYYIMTESVGEITRYDELRIISVVAHELAHQWFGNLVTMKWWTDLWLNEGFATYMASLAIQKLNPDLENSNETVFNNINAIFTTDHGLRSHPISQTIYNTSEIMNRFDAISYEKGSAVLRMLHMSLGQERFFEGIKRYLNKHKYGNAEQDDLWNAFTESNLEYDGRKSNINIKTVMDSWTLQAGFPLLKVQRDYKTGSMDISQQRFTQNSTESNEDSQKCWYIPLSYTTSAECDFNFTRPKEWLRCDENDKRVSLRLENVTTADDWIIFNIQLSGVYRVMYDPENWHLIAATLNSERFKDIHVLNRVQIVDDVMALVRSGYLRYNTYFEILEYLHRESETLPWEAVFSDLQNIYYMLKPFPEHAAYFQAFLRYIIEPFYHKIGGLNITTEIDQIKVSVITTACILEVEDCVRRSIDYFQQWKISPDLFEVRKTDTDLVRSIYCTTINQGNIEDWNFLLQRYKETNDTDMFTSLGCSRNETLLRNMLDMKLQKQHVLSSFQAMVNNVAGIKLFREFFFSNLSKVEENVKVHVLLLLGFHIILPDDLILLNDLIDSNQEYFREDKESVEKALEKLKNNLEWLGRNLDDVKSYLEKRLIEMGIIANNVIEKDP